jgi:HK97 family phage major capsid protein
MLRSACVSEASTAIHFEEAFIMLKLAELGINRHGKRSLNCLFEDKRELLAEAQAIIAKAESEKRSVTVDEKKKFDEIHELVEAMAPMFTKAQAEEDRNRTLAERIGNHNSTGERWINSETGKEIRVLQPTDDIRSLYQPQQSEEPLSLGKFIRGIATGHWDNADAERRSMLEGTMASGGYLVPTPLSLQIIEKVRNRSVCIEAGAQTIPMSSATLALARLDQDPTPQWKNELAPGTVSDAAFSRVTLTARVLMALCSISIELVEDSAPNIDAVLRDALAAALSLEVDRACLFGSDVAPIPKGVVNQLGVAVDSTRFSANGSLITNALPTLGPGYRWLAAAIAALLGVNEHPTAVIFSPRTAGEFDQLVDTTGQPLRSPDSVTNIKKLATGSVSNTMTQGSSSVASTAIVGDFKQLLVGTKTQLQIEVSRAAVAGTMNAFQDLGLAVRAYLRMDCTVGRPAAFRVVNGIL